jgi:hypothetical protein
MLLRLLSCIGVLLLLSAAGRAIAQQADNKAAGDAASISERPASVSVNTARAYRGYTLIAPMRSKSTFLIDMTGRVVNTWESNTTPALVSYLLENGHLLRPGAADSGFLSPGFGGRVQEFDWDGKLVWDYTFAGENQHPHHDIKRLPNGNILMIISDRKNAAEALAAGRNPELIREVLNADAIVEIKPTGPTTGEIVWQWHVWDHLVQDHDKTKNNYGDVSAKPERVDINYADFVFGLDGKSLSKKDLDQLRSLGYIGNAPEQNDKPLPASMFSDWTHFNSVAYNADLDQIMISVHSFSEIWIIDHSTTTAEAASTKGGRYGKGGDLLYRCGNPRAYRSGTNVDQRFFRQHNAHWIEKGLPGEGHVLIFNNGLNRPDGKYSSVDEVALPVLPDGTYEREPELPFTPPRTLWTYTAPKKTDFFDPFISSAQRLPNGNTLVCSGTKSIVFEVTPDKETVWKLSNPNTGLNGFLRTILGKNALAGGLFRAYRYGLESPAINGREVRQGGKIEEF